MKYFGQLEKIKSTHSNLRTDVVEGNFDLPVPGECFTLIGKGLEFGSRLIHTTPVVSAVKEENKIIFTTNNSTYRVTITGEEPCQEKQASEKRLLLKTLMRM